MLVVSEYLIFTTNIFTNEGPRSDVQRIACRVQDTLYLPKAYVPNTCTLNTLWVNRNDRRLADIHDSILWVVANSLPNLGLPQHIIATAQKELYKADKFHYLSDLALPQAVQPADLKPRIELLDTFMFDRYWRHLTLGGLSALVAARMAGELDPRVGDYLRTRPLLEAYRTASHGE